VVHRPLRLHQVAAYSGQSGGSEECAVLFARFDNEKRFFVMAITQLASRSPAGMSGTWGRPVACRAQEKAPARGRGWEETYRKEKVSAYLQARLLQRPRRMLQPRQP